jgi:hypothetical protein
MAFFRSISIWASDHRAQLRSKLARIIVLTGARLSLAPTSISINGVANVNGDGTADDDVTRNILKTDFAGQTKITSGAVSALLGVGDLSLASMSAITVNDAINRSASSNRMLAAADTFPVNAGITSALRGNLILAATPGGGIIGASVSDLRNSSDRAMR